MGELGSSKGREEANKNALGEHIVCLRCVYLVFGLRGESARGD